MGAAAGAAVRGAAHAWGVCCAGGVCCVPVGTVLRVHTDTHCTRSARVVYVCCACLCGCVQIHTRVLCGCCVLCVWGVHCVRYVVCVCVYTYVCLRTCIVHAIVCTHTYHLRAIHTVNITVYTTHTHICVHTLFRRCIACVGYGTVCVCAAVCIMYTVYLCYVSCVCSTLPSITASQGILQGFLPANVPNSPSSALPKRRERLC